MPARESAFLSKDGSRRRFARLTGITNCTNREVAEGSGSLNKGGRRDAGAQEWTDLPQSQKLFVVERDVTPECL